MQLINLSDIDNFCSENFRECWETNPGQLSLEAKMYYAAPLYLSNLIVGLRLRLQAHDPVQLYLLDDGVFGDDRISGAAEHVDGFELALVIKNRIIGERLRVGSLFGNFILIKSVGI